MSLFPQMPINEGFRLREATGSEVYLYSLDTLNQLSTKPNATYEIVSNNDAEPLQIIKSFQDKLDLIIYLENGKVLILQNYFFKLGDSFGAKAHFNGLNQAEILNETELAEKEEKLSSMQFDSDKLLTGLGGLSLGLLASSIGGSSINANSSIGNDASSGGTGSNSTDNKDQTNNEDTQPSGILDRTLMDGFTYAKTVFDNTIDTIGDSSLLAQKKQTIIDDLKSSLTTTIDIINDTNTTDEDIDDALDEFDLAASFAIAALASQESVDSTNNENNTTENNPYSDQSPLERVLSAFNHTVDEFLKSNVSTEQKTPILNTLMNSLQTASSQLSSTSLSDSEINTIEGQFLVANAQARAMLAAATIISSTNGGDDANDNIVINNYLNGTNSGTQPSVTPKVLGFSSTSPDDTYKPGDTITIQLTGNEAFNVGGTQSSLRVLLNNGEYATYQSGSGTKTLSFAYTVVSGDFNQALDTSSISLENSTLTNSNGTDFTLTGFTNLATNNDIRLQPAIIAIDTNDSDGNYILGDNLTLTVTFSDPLIVSGDASNFYLALNSGGYATYLSGSNTNSLSFEYVLSEGDLASNLEPVAIAENGATLTSLSGAIPSTSLPSSVISNFLTAHDISIDADLPRITSISQTENSRADIAETEEEDSYYEVTGALTLNFDQPVLVTEALNSNMSLSLSGLFTGTDDNNDGTLYNDVAMADLILTGLDGSSTVTSLSFEYQGFLRDAGSFDAPEPLEVMAAITNNTIIMDTAGNPALLGITSTNNIAGSLNAGAGRFLNSPLNVNVTIDDEEVYAEENTNLSNINLQQLVGNAKNGNLLLSIADANGEQVDYLDEYLGTEVSLARGSSIEQSLRALFAIEDVKTGKANFVSPLTELAVLLAEHEGVNLNTLEALKYNQRVADFFHLESLEFPNPVFITDADFKTASPEAQLHALTLATLSVLDGVSCSIDATLTSLLPMLSHLDTSDHAQQAAQELLSDGREILQYMLEYSDAVQADTASEIDLILRQMSEPLIVELEENYNGENSDLGLWAILTETTDEPLIEIADDTYSEFELTMEDMDNNQEPISNDIPFVSNQPGQASTLDLSLDNGEDVFG